MIINLLQMWKLRYKSLVDIFKVTQLDCGRIQTLLLLLLRGNEIDNSYSCLLPVNSEQISIFLLFSDILGNIICTAGFCSQSAEILYKVNYHVIDNFNGCFSTSLLFVINFFTFLVTCSVPLIFVTP